MCSSMLFRHTPLDVAVFFGLPDLPTRPNELVTPGASYPLIVADSDTELMSVQGIWGLIPQFIEDARGFSPPYNARLEGLSDKRVFADSLPCVIPCTAFFDGVSWVQPYDRTPMALAGVYDHNNVYGLTFTMLTMGAMDGLERDTNRMPVPLYDFEAWLFKRKVEIASYTYNLVGALR